ncbi:MAG TPA: hypothetical protein IAB56_05760 [Candidatus Scybalousia intestinigallinarum]|nr:hypothetical protein [Candidatus Scybalousia intestinigallinarum]
MEEGEDGHDRYQVGSVTTERGVIKVTITPRHGTSYGDNDFYVNHSDGCPEITLYQRRATTSKINTNKYYILADFADSQGETAQVVRDACVGKKENAEVLSGYICRNLLEPISGERLLTTCSEDQLSEIESSLSTAYRSVTDLYNELAVEIDADKLDGSQFSTKSEAETGCGVLRERGEEKSSRLQSAYDNLNLGTLITDKATEFGCKLPADTDILNNYQRQITLQRDGLMTSATKRYNDCINTANITSDEKTDLKNEAQNNLEDIKEENAKDSQTVTDAWRGDLSSISALGDNLTDLSCEGILGDDLLDKIDELFGYIKIAAPIILIVLGSVDFGQVVLTEGTDNKDALKKATSKFIKRAIICVAIFFVPTILSYILHFVDGIGADPLCGIK